MNVLRKRYAAGTLIALMGLAVACGPAPEEGPEAPDTSAAPDGAPTPTFEVDLDWPQPLPNDWILSSILGLFVDAGDEIWVSHRPELLEPGEIGAIQDPPTADCCVPAPLVLRFDSQGGVVDTWGSHEEWDEWPSVLHGLFVDHNDYVWTTARDQHQVMKFTRAGEHVLTIGVFDERGTSDDPERMGRPADIYVDPDTNELFVVDGYVNRRVIVFDADSGEYLRHWGAYGEAPDDDYEPGEGGPDDPPAQFSTVHGITGSHDGLIYVADRNNSRVQVFDRDGGFVMERILREGSGAAFDVALSHDPGQEFLYVADGVEHQVWVLRRDGLEVLDRFGSEGTDPGQFGRPHNLSVDSQGNLYVAEAAPGRRVQRFLLQAPLTQ